MLRIGPEADASGQAPEDASGVPSQGSTTRTSRLMPIEHDSSNPIPSPMPDMPSSSEQRGDPNGMLSLAKWSKIPIERIRYLPDSTISLIADVHCGMLFVMAFWSVPSIKAFHELTEILSRLDPDGRLEFVVVDTDGVRDFHKHPEFKDKLGGYGEVAWIHDGVIQYTSGLGYNPDCFEPNTKALFAKCRRSPGTTP